MTLSSETVKVQYDGDDSTTAFSITFVFWDNADIRAVLRDTADGTETVWVLGTDFTLTGGSGSTGTLTATVAPTSDETLTIKSNRSFTQETDLPLGGPLPSTDVELMSDQAVRLIQQLNENVSRAILLPESTAVSDATFPDLATNAEELLRINASGTGLEGVALASLSSSTLTTPVSLELGGTAADLSSPTALYMPRINAAGGAFELISPPAFNAALFTKGGDIASASPLVIDTDGGFFDVTGTTGFSAMTVAAGRLFMLQFDGALTMTDGASLDLGGSNITTAAGDRGLFYATAANTAVLVAWVAEGEAVLSQSTAAALAAETDENSYAPPDLIKYSPCSAKSHGYFEGDAADVDGSFVGYNVSAITDNGAGSYTVNIDTPDMSTVTYTVVLGGVTNAAGSDTEEAMNISAINLATLSFVIDIENDAGTNADSGEVSFAVFGVLA